jgi:opacity protein-like surface antigen
VRKLVLILFFFVNQLGYAQFDKKLTFSAFVGAGLPVGVKLDADSTPYVFSNFKNVFQLGGGVQYNIGSKLSFGINTIFLYATNYVNPLPVESKAQDIIEKEKKNYASSYLTNLAIGPAFKYKFFRNTAFNPYIFGEINFNYYNGYIAPRLQYYDLRSEDDTPNTETVLERYAILRFNSTTIPPSIAVGTHFGMGFDIKLSDTFAILYQLGYQINATATNNAMRKNMEFFSTQIGLRFSIIKSKSIL